MVDFSTEKVAKLENGESVQISNLVSETTEDILINNASKIVNTECEFDKLYLSKLTLSMVQMIAVGDMYSFAATGKELPSPKCGEKPSHAVHICERRNWNNYKRKSRKRH